MQPRRPSAEFSTLKSFSNALLQRNGTFFSHEVMSTTLSMIDGERGSKFSGCNFSNDLLPSLGATTQHPPKLRKYLVSPYDPRYKVWEAFLILLVVYSAWICPLECAFVRYLPSTPFVLDDVVNGFFAVHIMLTFFVPYVDKKSYLLVDDPKKIAVRDYTTPSELA